MRLPLSFCLLALLASCSSSRQSQTSNLASSSSRGGTFNITEISTEDSYGYTAENPVKVGGQIENGAANERKYLNSLTGPNGEELEYHRLGSCCHFKTANGIMGTGLLDRYEVKYAGLSKPIIIYINMYDKDELKAPKGFKFKE